MGKKKGKNSKITWRHVPTESVVEFQERCPQRRGIPSFHVEENTCDATKWTFYNNQETNEHEMRLAALLKANQKEAHKVPQDGNCFYNAVCHQVRHTYPELDGHTLRQLVCDHLVEHKGLYIGFIQFSAFETYEDKICSELRATGLWNSYLGDLLPLSISNMFNTQVEIFSSGSPSNIKVVPTLPESTMKHDSIIQLVYSARPGREHYDSCV